MFAMISSSSRDAPTSTFASEPVPVMKPVSSSTGSYSRYAEIEVTKVRIHSTPVIRAIRCCCSVGAIEIR